MIPVIQNSFVSGELSPSFLGRADKPQYKNGASTMRNMFVRYQGGAYSRAGFAYCGMCRQGAPNPGGVGNINTPPRDINFQFSINQGYALEFGEFYMRVKSAGAYITEAAQNITGITNAAAGVVTYNNSTYTLQNNDWVYFTGVGGMTALNGLTFIVQGVSGATCTLTDLFGNVVNTTNYPAFTSGGTLARIYNVASPYAAADLPYLKFTQNANLMNFTCWNQLTNVEYPPYTLQRISNTNWVFTAVSFASVVPVPTNVASTATNSTTANTWYSYVVTAVDNNGNESIASKATDVLNNNISINAGSNTVTWSAPASNISSYNIYSATPAFTIAPYVDPGFIGAPYGIIGSSVGFQFTDTNIIRDFTVTPPTHQNPFARGQILDVTKTSAGSGYLQSTIGYTITTSTGSGFSGTPIVQGLSGNFVGFYVQDNGQNYANTDTIAITSSGTGAGGAAALSIGAHTGTYPGSIQYFQQRLVYANTIDQPDTYFMSQPGLYSNFNSAIPTVASDAIIGTPWGVQINGIQFMVPCIQGLLTFTGNGVWLINGGNSIAITPSDENALAQAQIGCSAVVPPLYVNLHVLYVQAKNSIVRDIAFDFLTSVFKGVDITVFSNHLFLGYTLLQWAYAEEPYKVIWAVRNDGAMLSLTYIKEQEIQGWARHDTNGQFVGVCAVIEPPVNENVSFGIEPPVDIIYIIAKRYIPGTASMPAGKWVYYSERANNRIWQNIEDCFCVDAGLFYPLTFPSAVLTPAAANGTSNITSANIIAGGSYPNHDAVVTATDSTGAGSGATFIVTYSGNAISAVTPVLSGQSYTVGATQIAISSATGGSGAIIQPIITNYVTFTASSSVFTAAMVGSVIRACGGKATIISQTGTACVANMTQPITQTVPNDPNFLPVPAISGTWSVGAQISTVTGLNHLEGMTVTGLADGGVIVPQIVTNGAITLQTAASAINVGLPFTAQVQTMYLEVPSQTTDQGKRKDIQAATIRLEDSRGASVGCNMPDSSMQPNQVNVPWTGLKQIKERNNLINAGTALPLFTGDYRILLPGDWNTNGQVAVEQIFPLPLNVLAVIPELTVGDIGA